MGQKVRVVTHYGDSSAIGLMDPQEGMPTQAGTIFDVEADTQVCQVVDGNALRARLYAHQLQVKASDASGYGWPSSGGSVPFGHKAEVTTDYTPGADSSNKIWYMGPNGVPAYVTRT